ncbi:outer membrane beta-barrel protein [Marinomonas balearica]|uniref:Outer membrane protein with beta-barrel domain n=1 Tax=Marinomonas balearica TaxID=491947 RepID=A0A4R6M864_9GAMM|nr:outer membrane beta-barrel protein [Marinomonas balearica]TDO97356.1 outer membrane protein with beta-barrel domain [Marinomonas balearica]
MKRLCLAASFFLLPITVYADDSKFQFGVGFFGQSAWAGRTETQGQGSAREQTVYTSGVYANSRYVFNDNVALDANFHWAPSGQKETRNEVGGSSSTSTYDIEGFSATEVNANFLVGLSLYRRGWYGFTGVGVFQEEWEYTGGSERFTGFQVPVGLGYNFKNLSMEFQVGFKNVSDYAEFYHQELSRDSLDLFVGWAKFGVLANF